MHFNFEGLMILIKMFLPHYNKELIVIDRKIIESPPPSDK